MKSYHMYSGMSALLHWTQGSYDSSTSSILIICSFIMLSSILLNEYCTGCYSDYSSLTGGHFGNIQLLTKAAVNILSLLADVFSFHDEEWDGWVTGWVYIWVCSKETNCFPEQLLNHFTLPPATNERSKHSHPQYHLVFSVFYFFSLNSKSKIVIACAVNDHRERN